MQKPINSAKNARPKIAGILKIKTQKVGGSLKKERPREWAEHCIKDP